MYVSEGWLSPGGHSSGGGALTAKVRGPRAPVQSRVAAGFSQFSKNILKPFLTYNVACVLYLVAP